MQAHANDLRSEVERDWHGLVDNAAAGAPPAVLLDDFVHQVVRDWREIRLRPSVRALLEHAEQVTRAPASCGKCDVDRLRAAGWSDAAIHDAVQVVAYFNYINRIADALGVDAERGLPEWG